MTWRLPVICVAVVGALAIARPWTVRPLNDQPAKAFDADAYVASIWSARVLTEATATAMTVTDVRSRGIPEERRSVFVKGTGTIARVDLESRAGVARIDFGQGVEADLQIGPVLRGTAVRDALSFIKFSDFTNQIEYAQVASALNARVLDGPLKTIDAGTLRGRVVHVVGALATSGGRWELTPVAIAFEAGRQ
jgi:predicted lipoprotein